MASKLPPATPRPKPQLRGNASESADHQKGSSAGNKLGSNNGDQATPKSTAERRASRAFGVEKRGTFTRGADLQQIQEELAKTKEQLAIAEKSKSNLMHDLYRSKKNVEELTAKLHEANETCKKDRMRAEQMEHATFTAAEDWQTELDAMKKQYEAAVLELQTNRDAMESLKQELVACVEAKDEAVRLAGDAMSAAESTAKKVEELSAELEATKASLDAVDSATGRIDELMKELSTTRQSLLDATESREKIAREGAAMLASKEADLKEIMEAASNARGEIESLKEDLALAKNSVLTSNAQSLRSDAATGAETKATAEVCGNSCSSVRSDLEKARLAESQALAVLARVSAELEETHESLVKSTVEGTALATSIEFLKREIQRRESYAMDLQVKEANATLMVAELNDRIAGVMKASEAELSDLKEKESGARAQVDSLKAEVERLTLEMITLKERESTSRQEAASWSLELEKSRNELESAFRSELASCQAELVEVRAKEVRSADKIASLTLDLHAKQAEVSDLQDRLSKVESKAAALTVELSSLAQSSKNDALHLKEREAAAIAKVETLTAEVMLAKKELEGALLVAKVAEEEGDKLRAFLQSAQFEKDQAIQEAQAARAEAMQCQEDAASALNKAEQARSECEKALETLHASDAESQEVMSAKAAAQAAMLEVELAREKAEVNRKEMLAAIAEAQRAKEEVEKAKKDASSAEKEAESLKSITMAKQEQLDSFKEEMEAAMGEVEKLRTELSKVQSEAREADIARTSAEDKLQQVLNEMEALKANRAESEVSQVNVSCVVLEEENKELEEKLRHSEERLGAAITDIHTLQTCKEELLRELQAARMEEQNLKRAVVEAHQQVVDTEKAKSIMEAEIQRLLDDSKQWKTAKDPIDIPVHSDGSALVSESREEKPLPDSPDHVSESGFSMVLRDDDDMQKDDILEEDVGHPGEMVPAKKKKKALLKRLHSYLDKRKNHQPS